MTTITYATLKRIYKALGSDFGKSAVMIFKDEEDRKWIIAHGHLYGGVGYYRHTTGEEIVGFTDYGCIGSYSLTHYRVFEYIRPRSTEWHIDVGGVRFQFDILPPFDCRDCKHLIYIDEEESGCEGGGYNCRYQWDAGDTYLVSNTNECKGYICSKFEPTEYALKKGLIGYEPRVVEE